MRKFLLRLILLGVLIAPFAFLYLALEPEPAVARAAPATGESARETRALVSRLRSVAANPEADPRIEMSLSQINGALAFAGTALPGFRGEADLEGEGLRVAVSVPVPFQPDLGWWNLEAVVPSFARDAELARVSLGSYDLPPGVTLALAEGVANMVLGDALGTRVVSGLARFEVAQGGVVAVVDQRIAPGRLLVRRFSGLLNGVEFPPARMVDAVEADLRQAVADGSLRGRQSLAPWLRRAVEVGARVTEPGQERTGAAATLFALTRLCGSPSFGRFVDEFVGAYGGPRPAGGDAVEICKRVRLAGRDDLRKHFLTSAALEVGSNEDLSFAIGESKELIDSLAGGSGFDFTDMAANASGIRFAETLAATPVGEWQRLAGLLEREAAVMASVEGIPGRLSGAQFARRFGDRDSPAFTAMVSEIEERVAALPINRR